MMVTENINITSPTCSPLLSQFEFDTVRIFIDWTKLENYDFDYLKKLINAKSNGEEYNVAVNSSVDKYKGRYKGFAFLLAQKGITIIGSFSNYYLGHQKFLSYPNFKKAVHKLGLEVRLDLANARLFRVDVNFNVITDKKTGNYTNNLFVDLSRYRRLEQGAGVKFKTASKELVFYDKSLELLEKRGLKAENIYRIEYRILKNVKKHTGIVYLKELFVVENYYRLLNQFFELFKRVKKQSVTFYNQEDFKSVKAFENYLLALGIRSYGGEKEVFVAIEQFHKNGVFDNRSQKARLKKKMVKLFDTVCQKRFHPLVEEIQMKFDAAFRAETSQNFTINAYGK